MKNWLKHRAFSLVRHAQPIAARITRPLTMGVRAMIFDEAGHVCLIRQSYVAGWHMPGGGVEPGETLHESLKREMYEETGLALEEVPPIFAVYLNETMANRDHVALYVVHAYRVTGYVPSRLEVLEQGFFPPGDLPAGTTAPTRRRIAEVLEKRDPAPLW